MSVETAQTFHLSEIKKALNGVPEPQLSPEDAALERWDDLFEPPNVGRVEKFLQTKLTPFGKDKGNEHRVYLNEDGTKVIKIDNGDVDDFTVKERFLVHGTMRRIFGEDHLPTMDQSFVIKEKDALTGEAIRITGIVVDRIQEHPHFAQAEANAQNGDYALMQNINKNPFSKVVEDWQKANLPLPLDVDGAKASNYIIDPQGKQFLIDDVFFSGKELVGAKREIDQFLQKRGDSIDQRTRVGAGIRNLELLIAQNSTKKETTVYSHKPIQ